MQPDPHTYQPDHRLGIWRCGTLGRSSSGRLGRGVPCERCLLETWVFPHTHSLPPPPHDDRDKTDAASSSGPSAEDPGGSACDTARSRPGLELEELLETKLLCFFTIVFPNLSQVLDPYPPGGSSPRLEMAH